MGTWPMGLCFSTVDNNNYKHTECTTTMHHACVQLHVCAVDKFIGGKQKTTSRVKPRCC